MSNIVKNRIWSQYQKDIATDKYYFARSCIRQNFFPAAEELFLRIIRDFLKKDIFDDPLQTTCTGIAYHSGIVPIETTMTVVARQFALMTKAGYSNFVCSCVTSFGIYTEVLDIWKHNPQKEAEIRDLLYKSTGLTFNKPSNIVHCSDLIYKFRDELAGMMKYSLVDRSGNPIKVVDHVGCHYAKIFPEEGIGGAEYPYVLAGLIDSWGGAQVDYPERRHCCGFGFRNYLLKSNRGYSVTNSKIKFDSMKPYSPDLIIANCPGCTFFLDRWQYVIAEMEGITYGNSGRGIPVLTYEELAGILLGIDPWDIGLQVHQVSPDTLLDKMGIDYKKEYKYFNKNGVSMGSPIAPKNLVTL